MCICINCEFYKTCWIQKGLGKIDPYLNHSFRDSKKIYDDSKISLFLEMNILLNLFAFNANFELDVIECESFCESAGNWI